VAELERVVEESLVRSIVASRLEGLCVEVFTRAVVESGALAQPPLRLERPHAAVAVRAAAATPTFGSFGAAGSAAAASAVPTAPVAAPVQAAAAEPAAAVPCPLVEQPVWGLDAYVTRAA